MYFMLPRSVLFLSDINFHTLYAFTYNLTFSFLTFRKFLEPEMFYNTNGFQCLWQFQLSQLAMNIKTHLHIKLKHHFMFSYWTFTRTFNIHRAESEPKSVGPTLRNSLWEQLLLTLHSQSQFCLRQLPSLKTLMRSTMQVLHRKIRTSEEQWGLWHPCELWTGFETGPFCVGFMVDKVHWERVLFSSDSGIPCQYGSTNVAYSFIHSSLTRAP